MYLNNIFFVVIQYFIHFFSPQIYLTLSTSDKPIVINTDSSGHVAVKKIETICGTSSVTLIYEHNENLHLVDTEDDKYIFPLNIEKFSVFKQQPPANTSAIGESRIENIANQMALVRQRKLDLVKSNSGTKNSLKNPKLMVKKPVVNRKLSVGFMYKLTSEDKYRQLRKGVG